MLVTIRTEASVPGPERVRLARALRLALEPYRPRVSRASLRLRAERGGGWRADASVPLGPAGVVRVTVRAARAGPCAAAAVRRCAAAVAERLTAERGELLAFLLLASAAGRPWPGVAARRARAAPAPARRRAA